MEANKVFRNLINYIENSRLNYSMKLTTFSANISLKSSFIRPFDDVLEDCGESRCTQPDENMAKTIIILREKLKLAERVLEDRNVLKNKCCSS